AIAAEARRVGIPFGGHINWVTAAEASDSGARLIDHLRAWWRPEGNGGIDVVCWARNPSATVEQCRQLAAQFRHNGTWVVPTLFIHDGGANPNTSNHEADRGEHAQIIAKNFRAAVPVTWSDSVGRNQWIRGLVSAAHSDAAADSL